MPSLQSILSHFAGDWSAPHIEPLGNAGGFSGACFWRIRTADGLWCLRRWPPEHPDRQRLELIHAVLQHAWERGIDFVPAPRKNLGGGTYVEFRGHLWELARWLPGNADFREAPTRPRLAAALSALARFHGAMQSFSGNSPTPTVPPGLRFRHQRLHEMIDGAADVLKQRLSAQPPTALVDRGQRILRLFDQLAPTLAAHIDGVARTRVKLIPCIRDIWHDHVLLSNDRVTGIVDFGATRHDSVSGDIARLLGSLVRDDPEGWKNGLEAYQSERPLSEQERRLVTLLDRSNVALSGLQWLQWLYVQGRTFPDHRQIAGRLDEILARMEFARDARRPVDDA